MKYLVDRKIVNSDVPLEEDTILVIKAIKNSEAFPGYRDWTMKVLNGITSPKGYTFRLDAKLQQGLCNAHPTIGNLISTAIGRGARILFDGEDVTDTLL